MSDILTSITATGQRAAVRPDQVPNAAGGYVFPVGDEARLHRFLTLGTSDSTYYTSARELTRDNAEVLFRALGNDPLKVIAQILEISVAGRAPKQNPALFSLAVAASHGSDESRRAALAALPQVARTGSSLFTFIKYAEQFRGWGPAFVKAIAAWYNDKPVDRLAYQVLKYRSREDWRHDDVLRLAHPRPTTPARTALYNWLAATSPSAGVRRQRNAVDQDLHGNPVDQSALPQLVESFTRLRAASTRDEVLRVLEEDRGISWEMIPDQFLNEREVWEYLINAGVPMTALIRQLPRLTNIGLTTGQTGAVIADQLVNSERLKSARVHPINVLVAQKTYAAGRGEKGRLTWQPSRGIVDALNTAFYAAYGAIEPAGKRTLIALDVSGSMDWQNCSGLPITPREACAAISLVTAATETDTKIIAFTSGGWTAGGRASRWGAASSVSELNINPGQRLPTVTTYIRGLPAGGTDVSLPMLWAAANRLQFDTFYTLTDNETWAGALHPHEALQKYREAMGIDARMVVAAMTATGSSVCDPNDPRQLDVSGFDSSCPQLLADFSAGRV